MTVEFSFSSLLDPGHKVTKIEREYLIKKYNKEIKTMLRFTTSFFLLLLLHFTAPALVEVNESSERKSVVASCCYHRI
jgi:hypothetical protein